ncbi:MAG TPA: metal-dependent transcriptional regulator [Acidimicrobiia bacterium]|nr:metal-dependent transcriptional regulator [Acidimicrobiia bacterium]
MSDTTHRTKYREYVAAIYELHEADLPVIQARIADWLGVTRPSVSEMMKRMESEGLVRLGEQVTLTEQGQHLAEVVVRRHRLAERFLTEVLGMPWVKVHEEAEVWELAISDDVEKAMWANLGDPKTCPHGNPIPGAGYRPPPVQPISAMTDQVATLERISEELELDDDIMGFLDTNELRPGAEVAVAARTPDGIITVRVNDHAQVGLSSFIAERVYVAAASSHE